MVRSAFYLSIEFKNLLKNLLIFYCFPRKIPYNKNSRHKILYFGYFQFHISCLHNSFLPVFEIALHNFPYIRSTPPLVLQTESASPLTRFLIFHFSIPFFTIQPRSNSSRNSAASSGISSTDSSYRTCSGCLLNRMSYMTGMTKSVISVAYMRPEAITMAMPRPI